MDVSLLTIKFCNMMDGEWAVGFRSHDGQARVLKD